LLERGEVDAVLGYFEQCRTFWKTAGSRLDAWTKEVQAGSVPNFGANLRLIVLESGTHPHQLPWCDTDQDRQKIWNQGLQVLVPVSFGNKQHDGNDEGADILLKGKIAIDSQKHIECTLSQSE
jgi:hypothetical protein